MATMFSHRPSELGEVKSEAAINAAADPNSNVTAREAEQTIMDEARKAGSTAYFFDPNTSPEDKAAAVHATVPEGYYRDRKASAVGIVSDLPSSSPSQPHFDSPSGKKTVHYDLPDPTSNQALPAPASPTLMGSGNGHLTEEEKSRWESRVGWAPRFGEGLSEAEANESLLDQATLLETKLDDKFFGDWYHNAGVIAFACIASWVVALLGGGLGWVFIVMACCATYYRTSIRRVRRNFRDDVHREMAKARLETDTESLEWINSFLVKFWPIYAPQLCETIIAAVDQVLSTSTPAFLDSLRISLFTLGTKPPRLEFVKTYPKADDDIVLMDWKFSFTPGDKMDLTARQLKEKINPKIVLEVRLGKGVISKGIPVIVEDFAFSGLMRVKVKLQRPFPHIERADICFLGKPDIDYVCKPLGGEMGFDINFIPGLESFIIDMIHGTLAPIMYEPNVFPIEIAKMLAGNPVDQAIGVVAVTIHGAHGLKNPDALAGTPDPYVIVALNNRDILGKTKTIKQNANPRWNETIYVIVTSLTDALTLQVFDYNEFRKDKELGTASFALDRLEQVREHENLQLEVVANGKLRGNMQADVRLFPVLEGVKLEGGKQEPPPESNTGIVRYTIEQAKDLDGSKSMIGQLNPYAVLLLNGSEVHTTAKLKRTNQPIWQDGSKELLITNRKAAKLGLVVKDDRGLAGDPVLGTYQLKLDDMIQMMEQGKEWYSLSGATKGRVKLSVQWKPVALIGVTSGSGGYITPIGVMRFHFESARDLRNVETMGKSDPYVRVLVSGVEKAKTVTWQSNLNPDFDEVVYVPVHAPRERIILEVMDHQNIGKDRSLGLVELSAADYVQQADNGEYEVSNGQRQRSEHLRMHGRDQPKGKLNFTVAFYPTLNVADPEDEEADRKLAEKSNSTHSSSASKASVEQMAISSIGDDSATHVDSKENETETVDSNIAGQLSKAEDEAEAGEPKPPRKMKLTPEELVKYDTGLLVFKLISGDFARSNLHLEVVMDDMAFPSYTFSKATTKHTEFGETGDAMVRELDMSRITLRLMDKVDKDGGEHSTENVYAKLVGDTLAVLQQCLYKPSELTLRSADGSVSKITVDLRYLPIKMQLDPSESKNNMGSLRVDILDAADLPSADRNGFSDPYCKFELNGETVFKTKIQKKTLHPSWNEFFETPIKSRTAAKFYVKVMDWDMGDKDDFLGAAKIDLEKLEAQRSQEVTLPLDGKSGAIRMRLLFKSSYVTRSRQGSSTFSGSIAPAGKIIGAPIKGVGKVGGAVGDGIIKSTTFIRHGFKGSKDIPTVGNGFAESPAEELSNGHAAPVPSIEVPPEASNAATSNGTVESVPATPAALAPHSRSTSFGAKSATSVVGGTPGKPDAGTASITIVSATGFPPSAKVQIHVKQLGAKGAKEVFKTKAIKSSSGKVEYENESFKVNCPPDTQFQLQVKEDKTFGSNDLGEKLFFIDDSATGSEKVFTIRDGHVNVRTSFVHGDAGSMTSSSPRASVRKSFLGKRDTSRQGTPS